MQHASGSDAGAENWKRQKELQAEARKKENRLKKLEAEISGLEARSNEIDEEMSREEVFTDVGKVTSLSKEKAAPSKGLFPHRMGSACAEIRIKNM